MHSNSTLNILNEEAAERELRGRRTSKQCESLEWQCRLLANVLAACCLTISELEDDPTSTDRVAEIFCHDTGLERGDFDRLVQDVRATLASASRKLRDTSLRFRGSGGRHRNLDEVERQPDPLGRTRAQYGWWPKD
ncbi:MAG: hypothetical protein WAV15_02545 [Minisyncoccia bacterium]